MSSYENLNVAITQILPESASKVFKYIDDIFKSELSKRVYLEKLEDCNAGEKHFMCFYLMKYLNSDRYSSFDDWLEVKRIEYESREEELLFHDFKDRVMENRERLIATLVMDEKEASKRFAKYIKYRVPYNVYTGYLDEGQFNYRILLYYKTNDFKEYFIKAMEEIMTKEQAEEFFFNSFEYAGNKNSIPVKLLNIENVNQMTMYTQMFYVKKEYDKNYKYSLEDKMKKRNSKIEKMKKTRQVFFKKHDFKKEKAKGEDFGKIIYNAFPEMRNKYLGKGVEKDKIPQKISRNIKSNEKK